MMKKTVLMLFVGLLSIGIYAQGTTAKIEFKSETIDYGEIAKGSDGVRVFEFTNTGTAPLVISDVKSSCGCTIPKKPELDVKLITKRSYQGCDCIVCYTVALALA